MITTGITIPRHPMAAVAVSALPAERMRVAVTMEMDACDAYELAVRILRSTPDCDLPDILDSLEGRVMWAPFDEYGEGDDV